MEYSPTLPVVTVTARSVPKFVTVTVAPETTAPEVSVTVPAMRPVSDWAKEKIAKLTTHSSANPRNRLEHFIYASIVPSIFSCFLVAWFICGRTAIEQNYGENRVAARQCATPGHIFP